MEINTINKSIEIKAGKDRVWEVLTTQPYLNEVLSIFMAGSTVKGEFKDGAQVIYLDPSGRGVAGKVTEYKPQEALKIAILAEITNGEPDFDHPDNKKWEGCYDQYKFTEKDGVTTLIYSSVFPPEHYNDFAPGWDRMLGKIKEFSEK